MEGFQQDRGTLADAARHLALGNYDRAAQIAQALALSEHTNDSEALNVLGILRAHQKCSDEAVILFSRSLQIRPRQPYVQLNLGKLLLTLDKSREAIAALRAAIKLKPDFLEAFLELARALHVTGDFSQAENTCRKLLRLKPENCAAKLVLSDVLRAQEKFEEAEIALRRALGDQIDSQTRAQVLVALAKLLGRRGRHEEALSELERAAPQNASHPAIDQQKVELLHDLKRYDQALNLYRAMLLRDPFNVRLHNEYNDLLYRLGRQEDYLKSFDRVRPAPALQFAKASFLMHGERYQEAFDVFQGMLTRNSDDKHAWVGLATTLSRLGRYDEAVDVFDKLLSRHKDDPNLYANAAAALITYGDARRALALCEQGSKIAPDNQICLALMGTALRLLKDERDETLNGYDTLIRVFDLDPPDGYSDMAAFNAELNRYLDRLHPDTREHIAQSLRGGSQTIDEVFGAGHRLIDQLQKRISQAVNHYIQELRSDQSHPFISRRRKNFSYAGSWSSRLGDNGFHANHMHPGGWISSCYYVAVPEIVADNKTRQGWIKFGEPDLSVDLKDPIRRAIQPRAGRLVLFPSYMWHGTIAFSSETPRTTIAFDAVPRE